MEHTSTKASRQPVWLSLAIKTFRVVFLLRRTPVIRIPQVNCNGAVNEFDLTAVNIQTQYSHEPTYVTVVQYIISVGVPEAT